MFLILEAIEHRNILNHNLTLGVAEASNDTKTTLPFRKEPNAKENMLDARKE
jgi:hypothetical protein